MRLIHQTSEHVEDGGIRHGSRGVEISRVRGCIQVYVATVALDRNLHRDDRAIIEHLRGAMGAPPSLKRSRYCSGCSAHQVGHLCVHRGQSDLSHEGGHGALSHGHRRDLREKVGAELIGLSAPGQLWAVKSAGIGEPVISQSKALVINVGGVRQHRTRRESADVHVVAEIHLRILSQAVMTRCPLENSEFVALSFK